MDFHDSRKFRDKFKHVSVGDHLLAFDGMVFDPQESLTPTEILLRSPSFYKVMRVPLFKRDCDSLGLLNATDFSFGLEWVGWIDFDLAYEYENFHSGSYLRANAAELNPVGLKLIIWKTSESAVCKGSVDFLDQFEKASVLYFVLNPCLAY